MVRAIEGGRHLEVTACLTRFPDVRHRVAYPCDFDGNLFRKLVRLRQFAVRIARGHAVEELRSSRADLAGEGAFKAQVARQRNVAGAARSAPS